jgi:riboflavin synthase
MEAKADMFTGLISDIGEIKARDGGRFRLSCHYAPETVSPGASIACDGCCLTAVSVAPAGDGGSVFAVDVSNETLSRTAIRDWSVGTRVNLERPLRLGEELGGHLVSGHVDACALLVAREPDGDSLRLELESPPDLARSIAQKGSVALSGVSLTVNAVAGTRFAVNIIPFTLEHTTLGDFAPGARLNLEIDMLARYIERLAGAEDPRFRLRPPAHRAAE